MQKYSKIIFMSYDSNSITYAVSLHFSKDVNEIISAAVKDIAKTTGNSFIIENKIPPHITIGAFHGSKEKETRLLQIVADFSKAQKSGIVKYKEIGNFNGKVLFLKPEKDEYLLKLNDEIHKLLLTEFERGENGYYLPQIWFPHTTLATRLNQNQFTNALNAAQKINLPLDAKVCEIALYQCSPFLELKSFPIS